MRVCYCNKYFTDTESGLLNKVIFLRNHLEHIYIYMAIDRGEYIMYRSSSQAIILYGFSFNYTQILFTFTEWP